MESELQAILDATMDVVVVFDSERRFASVNEAACRFYGRSRDELLGARLDEFIGTERAERDWDGFLSPERIAQGMLENVWEGDHEGGRRVLEVRARPEILPGRHLFVIRDVTERRRLEDRLRQAQKMEAVGQLAGGIAHDFNNLLTVISGYGHIARRHIGAGPGAAELREIARAAERATELTRQLLAFARQQVLEPALLDLNVVVRGLVPMLGRLIGEDIEIAMLAGRGLPMVLADRAQIEQVIINLAINARDAMPSGGTLTIETGAAELDEEAARERAQAAPGRYAYLKVCDTGTGIDPDVVEHIFEPFFTTKAMGFGTGLGLATVHGIVTQSSGFVHVDSEPGLGACFTVHLPAAAADAAGAEAARAPESSRRLAGSETILLCEDEDSVRRLIELVLVSEGYTVLATSHPGDALRVAAAHRDGIAALVTDIVMPSMSGLELAERLEPLLGRTRTLFVSGYAAEVAERRGKLPPGSAFLEKPFDQASLLEALRSLLDQPSRVI